jgi:hypothetical protein
VFDLDFGKVGIMICFDNYFPEVARILGIKGAELVLYPLYGDTLNPQWELKMKARAVDNTMYVAPCQIDMKYGIKMGISYTGMIDPEGNTIARLPEVGTWEVVEGVETLTATLVDDEKTKVTIESKGTASEEEAKASEGGAPSPETESVDEESSEGDKKSAAKRNKAITTELTGYGYDDFVIGQGFYVHTGLLLSNTSGGVCVNDYDAVTDQTSIDKTVSKWSNADVLQKSEFE